MPGGARERTISELDVAGFLSKAGGVAMVCGRGVGAFHKRSATRWEQLAGKDRESESGEVCALLPKRTEMTKISKGAGFRRKLGDGVEESHHHRKTSRR